MIKRVRFVVRGRVQGVGYRFFVWEAAERLGVSGWVRNCWDGSVEGEAEGRAEAVEKFLQEVRYGHPYARVDQMTTQETAARQETAFRILH